MSDTTQVEEFSDDEKISGDEKFPNDGISEKQPTSYDWRGMAGYGSRAL